MLFWTSSTAMPFSFSRTARMTSLHFGSETHSFIRLTKWRISASLTRRSLGFGFAFIGWTAEEVLKEAGVASAPEVYFPRASLAWDVMTA